MAASVKVALVVLAGAALRLGLFASGLDSYVQNRLEFITPLNSLQRLQESHFLYKAGLNPYAGDAFHQPPLVLVLYILLQALTSVLHLRTLLYLSIVALDAVIAFGFASLCQAFLSTQAEQQCERSKVWLNHPPVSPLLTPENLPAMAAAMYLFNPYSLISSLAMSTSIFTYAAVVWSLSFAMQGYLVHAIFFLSIATYLNVYPVVLLLPVLLMVHQARHATSSPWSQATYLPLPRTAFSLALFVASLGGWLALSHVFIGSWVFLDATYLWVLRYPDLTPNIGVFWYFFMELFDRFRNYFLFLLHLNPFLYVLPLYIRLRTRPLVYATVLLALFSIFQAYPAFGDVGFVFTCCIMHPASILGMQNKFVLATGVVVTSVLMPVMAFLWLYPGSGNANFFYNQTLIFQYFYVRGIAQFVTATLRRDKQLDEYFKLRN
ncbi:Aste57867_23077 [Aphanomyces stellatus]|uniref:Aste57867_23077 protein n=1 Tax=Aphanomyces stellatus TaxID=120398 RepID=A0A485LLY8_9STRA|nr:hypothetical protein As57867_023006 [Aphanomyces stellatus]VFT99725.1 Aste57867_23077 [Aphanomyces stellatus]